jgi:ABC-2 type transport system ATP-binding protein
MPIIEVENLTKTFRVFDRRPGLRGAARDLFSRRYRSLDAVADISFQIEAGEMVGYIGANGAGKSTTIKILTGILHQTAGKVRVAGYVPHDERNAYLREIGVVFGQRTQLWWDLAVQESFRLLQRIYDVDDADFEARMKRFDEVLAIGAYLRTPVRKLSLGEKMRCEICAALLHRPKVLFLDEPTIGLDVVAKAAIRDFLREINREMDVTMILTTHDLKDIEELCGRVLILDHGKLVYNGALADLHRKLAGRTVMRFHLAHSAGETEIAGLPGDGRVEWGAEEGAVLTASFDPGTTGRSEVIKRALERFEVRDIAMQEPSIEDVVRRVYREGGVKAGGENGD